MNGYFAFYGGKKIEVRADTSLEAQNKAAALFGLRPKQAWKVSIILVEKNGAIVVHTPSF